MTAQKYYQSKESVQEYIEMAKDVNSQQLIDIFKTYISPDTKILEIGSGPGTDWKILKKDFDILGSDNSKEFIKHLQTNNPDGDFLDLDAVSLNTQLKFDAIYSNKVFQHLSNEEVEQSIKRQWELLTNDGIICHSFWKGEGDEVFKGMFVNYQTEASLFELFSPSFEILYLDEYQEFEENDSLLIIGQRKHPIF